MIAAVPAAVAGTFFVQFTGIITPASLDLDRTVWILLIVILGGVGSLGRDGGRGLHRPDVRGRR
jgi:ABC-type branched-subunit amino acid transport system permease subunit